MSELIELYNSVSKKVQDLNAKINDARAEIANESTATSADISVRIKKLEEQLTKIDAYLLKIRGFQELAKKNLDSQNLLTIEAPPGYRVNLNRLRNWAMMIDPTSSNDPYAQRVYLVAKCDEHFLLKKQKEFKSRIELLKSAQASGTSEKIDELNRAIEGYKAELKQYALSGEISNFAVKAQKGNAKYWHGGSPSGFKNNPTAPPVIAPGAYALPLLFDDEQRPLLKGILGDFYDAKGGRVLLPVEISNESSYIIEIKCATSKRKKLDKAIQNLILTTIDENPAGARKVIVLDGVRFNSSSIALLRGLEGTYALEQIPRNPDQLTSLLEQIVSSFADEDELLENYDSIMEYNSAAQGANRIPLTTIIVYGWPNSFGGRDRELLQRIMTNYERYGVSIITISYQNSEKGYGSDRNPMPEYAMQNAIHINMTQNDSVISIMDGAPQKFTWYTMNYPVSADYIASVKSHSVEKESIGNEYIKRVDMENYPPYKRGKKSIVLPYGVDSKDEMHSISFDNENFAAYLMGASGSGKSTLLHTLITGILRDYHPDDVELWLADFKMSEFAQYIDPLPAHIKYILLDESPELVYDLLDRLTEKMMERQKFFMKHRDLKKVENVPSSIYMPVIFVILDEFSIMSQAVSESEVYKLRLQNLLAKGRALGIKFIFSSQTFTKGVAGLTQTAKDQIQTRIAMKNSYNEINETLELSSGSRTEQVKNWMEALPPHFALSKYRDEDHIQVKRLQVMYFKGKGDEALEPQRKLIRHINDSLRKVSIDDYNASVLDSYVDKKPVIVDGSSYKAFDSNKINALISEYKLENNTELSGDDTIITFGAPRRMVNAKFAVISNESRENLLLIARGLEQACEMSIILTAIKSFKLQGGKVHIWAYSKNRIFKAYKDSHFSQYEIAEGMSEICAAISSTREKIAQKEIGRDLIVMLGMEQICSDIDLIDFGGTSRSTVKTKTSSVNAKQYEAKSDDELKQVLEVQNLSELFREKYNIDALEDKWLDEGKPFEEITAEEEKMYQEFIKGLGAPIPDKETSAENESFAHQAISYDATEEEAKDTSDNSYNASEDFKYIIKQGSRFGYHFMLCLDDLSDLKVTQLQQDLFRHKLVFQISADDSVALFASKIASRLPEHVCQYSNSLEQYSLRPFIHDGVTWDGWDLDESGSAVNTISL